MRLTLARLMAHRQVDPQVDLTRCKRQKSFPAAKQTAKKKDWTLGKSRVGLDFWQVQM